MDATTYVKLKTAGKSLALAVPTKTDLADVKKTVKESGVVNFTAPVYDPATGAQVGTTTIRVQIASKLAERAALVKQLADLDVQLADMNGAV